MWQLQIKSRQKSLNNRRRTLSAIPRPDLESSSWHPSVSTRTAKLNGIKCLMTLIATGYLNLDAIKSPAPSSTSLRATSPSRDSGPSLVSFDVAHAPSLVCCSIDVCMRSAWHREKNLLVNIAVFSDPNLQRSSDGVGPISAAAPSRTTVSRRPA